MAFTFPYLYAQSSPACDLKLTARKPGGRRHRRRRSHAIAPDLLDESQGEGKWSLSYLHTRIPRPWDIHRSANR